jgi:DNA topoisomerase I
MMRSNVRALARKLGLRLTKPEELSIRRERSGDNWIYYGRRNRRIDAKRLVQRLDGLAVPPAYESVLYAQDAKAHLQAVGRDAAGRLQYVYHPDWTKIRELRKAERLTALIDVLPEVRRVLSQRLSEDKPSRAFGLACVIELIATSAIRAGGEEYVRERRTRGATTLLKSNVKCEDGVVHLSFRAKGGKHIRKSFTNAKLATALMRLAELPGPRLFQYRDHEGQIRRITAAEVNAYLKEIAGCDVSLKDFRTLCASAEVLERLAKVEPGPSVAARKRQINEALKAAAQTLENTPAICRKSYVHPSVLTAFEAGVLKQFADRLRAARSPARAQEAVGKLIDAEAA